MEVQEEISAVVVIWDHDLTASKRHSEGLKRQRSFEKPYEANLRALDKFRSHIQALRACRNKKVFFGVATLGEYKERIYKSWEAVGIERNDLFLCAKYLDELTLKAEGKNFHIATILLQIISSHPHVKIEKVIVVDDSPDVQNAITLYPEFITKEPWKDHACLNVRLLGILMPRPELEYEMIEVSGRHPRAVIKMQRDERFEAEVCVELLSSERKFIGVLNKVECLINPPKRLEVCENKSVRFQFLWTSSALNKKRTLARSLDGMALVSTDKINRLHDSSSSCSASDIEGPQNTPEVIVDYLFKSV